jgi:hypothetical protein
MKSHRELESQIEIQASPDLGDHNRLSILWRWNPFITSILSEARVGPRLKMKIRPVGGHPWDFQPKMLVSNLPGSCDGWEASGYVAFSTANTFFLFIQFLGTELAFSRVSSSAAFSCHYRLAVFGISR